MNRAHESLALEITPGTINSRIGDAFVSTSIFRKRPNNVLCCPNLEYGWQEFVLPAKTCQWFGTEILHAVFSPEIYKSESPWVEDSITFPTLRVSDFLASVNLAPPAKFRMSVPTGQYKLVSVLDSDFYLTMNDINGWVVALYQSNYSVLKYFVSSSHAGVEGEARLWREPKGRFMAIHLSSVFSLKSLSTISGILHN